MTMFFARFWERLPPSVRHRLHEAANILLPYRKRLSQLDSQHRSLQTAHAGQEQHLLQLQEEHRALRAAHADQEQHLLQLHREYRALQAAHADQEQHLLQLHREYRALQAAHADQDRHLVQLQEQNRTLQAASCADTHRITRLRQHTDELTAIRLTHEDRLARLEAHITALTTAAVERESKLQEKTELDYQLLIIHQQLLAEFADAEPRFHEIYKRCRPFTMTSIERLYSLYKAVEYLAAAEIPGDFVECGVWRGGSCMLMAETLLSLGKPNRRIFMFDTFDGHPAPDPERDIDLWGNHAYQEWRSQTNDGAVKGWGRIPLDEVISNLQSTGYPGALLRFVKGMVEDTAQWNLPGKLALLRLDTDWYASTQMALQHFYPLLTPGGVLILDDYGHYQGQRQAVDEYFHAIDEHLLFHRIDYSCRVAVKPAIDSRRAFARPPSAIAAPE